MSHTAYAKCLHRLLWVTRKNTKWEVAWLLSRVKAHRGLMSQMPSFIALMLEPFLFPQRYMPLWGTRGEKRPRQVTKAVSKKTRPRECGVLVWRANSLRVEKEVSQEQKRYWEVAKGTVTTHLLSGQVWTSGESFILMFRVPGPCWSHWTQTN